MSQQGALAYVERITSDAAFRTQIAQAPDPDSRRQLIEDAGFDVEAADKTAIEEALRTSSMELTDDELTGVSGGGMLTPTFTDCGWDPPQA